MHGLPKREKCINNLNKFCLGFAHFRVTLSKEFLRRMVGVVYIYVNNILTPLSNYVRETSNLNKQS